MHLIPMIVVGPADDYRRKAARSFGYGVFTGFLVLLPLAVTFGYYIEGDYTLMVLPGCTAILVAAVCAVLMLQYVAAKLELEQVLNAQSVEAAEKLIAAVKELKLGLNDSDEEEE